MNNIKTKFINFIIFISFTAVTFGVGYNFGQKQNPSTFQKPSKSSKQNISNFDLYWDTWAKVQEKFIDRNKLDAKKMYYGAIKGMVSSLEDPYTFFLTPEENQQSKDDLQGKFEGIGAQLGLKDSRIIIIAPLKKSPAEAAGTRAGDYINKVDDQTTKGWTLPQAVSKIRGPKGSKVKLTLERNNKEFDVSIVRDQIIVSSVELSYQNNIAILKLNQFGENTNEEWDKAVSRVKDRWDKRELRGLVIDVRDNPGGYLESSVYVASEFLPLGQLVVKQVANVGSKEYRVSRLGKLTTVPLVILINKGSASASEILAGALRDHKKARLVGEKSFGKGSVQEAIDLRDSAGLHVTVAKWILPKGDWINSKGIEPEIKIENKLKEGETLTNETDSQLKKAIDLINK